MEQIKVNTPTGTYPIIIEKGLAKKIISYIPNIEKYTEFVIVTDENVYNIYGEMIDQQFYQTEKMVETIVIPAGDESKCLEVYDQVIETMLERCITRKALLVAVGGGMIGDFGGFVAASYMRGIDFVQVPTTLLAHDSAIGGKVALNHQLAKNVIGAFYQPQAVMYDPDLLQTLSPVEWISGFGEVVKHSEIDSDFHLEYPETIDDIKNVSQYLKDTINVKRKIVEKDPFEQGNRIFLNYGHTFAHALEQHLNYQVPHGVCVIWGLIFVGLLEKREVAHYYDLLNIVKLPKIQLKSDDLTALCTYMKRDKKQQAGTFSFLMKENGTFTMKPVSEMEMETAYKQILEMM